MCFRLKLYFKLITVTIFLLFSKFFYYNLHIVFENATFFGIFLKLMFVNSIQGLFIFVLFTMNKKSIWALKKKVSNVFSNHTAITEINSSENQTNEERYTMSTNEDYSI